MAESSRKLSSAINEAQSIVEAAEKRAAEMLGKADEVYQQARDEGYREGYETGRAEAVMAAVRLLEDSGAVGDTLALHAAKLALEIAKSVVAEQIKVDPEMVKRIALQALRESILGDVATIIVNPADAKLLEKGSEELRRVAGGVRIAIETDADMVRGGCIVRTEFGEVDATIDTLLFVIRQRLGIE